jgi:hypothetical protein
VITGFNTDIEYDDTTYHVQTEDKGLETPLILSLVYDGGTILASKRSRYEDLIEIGFDEKVLAERLQKQHNLICAAIRGGRIEDLKRMTMKASNSNDKKLVIEKPEKPIEKPSNTSTEKPIEKPAEHLDEIDSKLIPQITSEQGNSQRLLDTKRKLRIFIEEQGKPNVAHEKTRDSATETIGIELPKILLGQSIALPEFPPKIEQPDLAWHEEVPVVEEMYVDKIEIVEELEEVEAILPAEAVEIITEIIHSAVTPPTGLSIELLNENSFKGGERKTFSILVSNGEPVEKAIVLVKILGSSFRPVIFHAKTDNNGIAIVHAQLPHFKTGRAAILFKATAGGEDVELRRSISQG